MFKAPATIVVVLVAQVPTHVLAEVSTRSTYNRTKEHITVSGFSFTTHVRFTYNWGIF